MNLKIFFYLPNVYFSEFNIPPPFFFFSTSVGRIFRQKSIAKFIKGEHCLSVVYAVK